MATAKLQAESTCLWAHLLCADDDLGGKTYVFVIRILRAIDYGVGLHAWRQ